MEEDTEFQTDTLQEPPFLQGEPLNHLLMVLFLLAHMYPLRICALTNLHPGVRGGGGGGPAPCGSLDELKRIQAN